MPVFNNRKNFRTE